MKMILHEIKGQARLLPLLVLGALLAFPPDNTAQDVAGLLEKGIYMEETQGDLPGAIAVYQQALEAARNNESFAAEALYRLAVCHLKQKDTLEAHSLLERLIEKYPGQAEWVAKAKDHLPAALELQPVPWKDGEVMVLHFRFPAGARIGMTAYYANRVVENNQQAWVVGQQTSLNAQSKSAVTADLETFQPFKSHWKHTLIGEATAIYSGNHADVTMTDGSIRKVPLEKTTWDNEQVIHLLRRLPLQPGYKASLQVITTLGGGMIIPFTAEVVSKETVEVPAGKFEAYKIELSLVHQSFWVSADENRYLLKIEAGGAIGELHHIEHRAPGQPNVHRDADLGFSFSTAPGWHVYEAETDEKAGKKGILLLDPEAEAISSLAIQPLNSLPRELQSLKNWAEDRAREAAKHSTDYAVRQDSWTDLQVAGYPAISFTADFTEIKTKQPTVHYSVVVFTPGTAANFFTRVEKDKFARFKPEFDQIVGSFLAR